jgi:GNAT superfamily N-acetyltransferase
VTSGATVAGRQRGRRGAQVTEVAIPLLVRDLIPEDLPSCAWSGSALHLATVAGELERARLGEVDYLAACPPSGLPVAVGGIDYAENPGAGTLYQLSVHPALQSCGIGTIFIQAAEQRILARSRSGLAAVRVCSNESPGTGTMSPTATSLSPSFPNPLRRIARWPPHVTATRRTRAYRHTGIRYPIHHIRGR